MSFGQQLHQCTRCGNEWLGRYRSDGRLPVRCSKCRTPLWNVPKVKPSKVDVGAVLAHWQGLGLEVVLYVHHHYRNSPGNDHVSLRIEDKTQANQAEAFISGTYKPTVAEAIVDCLADVERWERRELK